MWVWIIGALAGLSLALFQSTLPPPALLWALAVSGLLLLRAGARYWRCCCGCLLGYCWCCLAGLEQQARVLPDDCQREPLVVHGRVQGLPRETLFDDKRRRQRFEFAVLALHPMHCRGPATVLLSYYGDEQIEPGETWQFKVRLRQARGLANPGSFSFQAWYMQSGIDALGSVRGEGVRIGREVDLGQLHHRLRLRVSRAIAALDLADELRAVLRAITVADRSGLTPASWQLFQALGISHLLVISGLHIGMVAGLGALTGLVVQRFLVMSGFYLPRHPGPLMALAAGTSYAALAGFSVATQRALLMLLMFCMAALLQRSSRAWLSLLYAVALILLLNPFAALGSGFWLSIGAVAMLLWWSQWHPDQGLVGRVLSVHLWMSVAMLPMTGWWFGGGSLIAGLVNALMVPLVSLWVVPLSLLATGLELLGMPGSSSLWSWAVQPVAVLYPFATRLVSGESPWVYASFTPGLLAAGLALLALMSLVLPMTMRSRGCLIAALLPLALLGKERQQAGIRLIGLDVGQGTAMVLLSRSRALVYDTGGGDPAGLTIADSVVLPFLRGEGVARLDTLVISHPDTDHSAGARSLSRALPASRQLAGLPLGALPQAMPCRTGLAWRWPEGVRFQVLAGGDSHVQSSNDASCVLAIEYAGQRLLLPGDISSRRERELVRYWRDQLDASWLLAAHHGSHSSSGEAWMKTVSPDLVLFSHGHGNRFGHPHTAVVQRVERAGAQWQSTADAGAVEYRVAEDGRITVHKYRETLDFWWM